MVRLGLDQGQKRVEEIINIDIEQKKRPCYTAAQATRPKLTPGSGP
jgi:hypothetical protein